MTEAARLTEPAGRWIVAVTVLGSAITMVMATVVNVALPDIGQDFGTDVAGLQWVVNSYLITLAALILVGGSLGDRYGRGRVYVLGAAGFMVTSALCALAPTLQLLLVARAAQGVAAAVLTPLSLAILQSCVAPPDRGRAIGLWSALTGIGAAAGPILGGWLTDVAGWPGVFWMVTPLAAVVAVLARRHVPPSRDPQAQGLPDLTGAVLGAVGLAAVSFTLLRSGGRDAGVDAPAVVAAVVGVAALSAFFVVERRRADPMLPLAMFRSTQFSAANAVTLIVYGALGGVFFLLIVHLQTVLGYSALEAGTATVPITLLMLLSPTAGDLAQRHGPRRPLAVGPLLLAGGMLLMAGIDTGDGYWTAVLPAVAVFGMGLATTVAPITATALAAAPAHQVGVASGVNNTVARTAQMLAVAVLPLVAGLTGDAYQRPQVFSAGFSVSMQVAAAAAAAGGVLAWLTIRDEVLTAEPRPGRRGSSTTWGSR